MTDRFTPTDRVFTLISRAAGGGSMAAWRFVFLFQFFFFGIHAEILEVEVLKGTQIVELTSETEVSGCEDQVQELSVIYIEDLEAYAVGPDEGGGIKKSVKSHERTRCLDTVLFIRRASFEVFSPRKRVIHVVVPESMLENLEITLTERSAE